MKKKMKALTPEQQIFAAQNHETINFFLRKRRLAFDDYYDVVIFGYLDAVRAYCEYPVLRSEYTFDAVASKAMLCDLFNYWQSQYRQKRKAPVISLDSNIPYDGGKIPVSETIGVLDERTAAIETDLIWEEIASRLSDEQVNILRMREAGYDDSEIAEHHSVSEHDIDGIVSRIQRLLRGVCLV